VKRIRHAPNRQGDITEIMATTLLLDKGYEVFRNASCIGKIDMIVYRPKKNDYLYLDLKTGSSKEVLTPNKWQVKLGVRCATIKGGKVRYMSDKNRLILA
jgi:hypothetical protein